MEAELDEPNGTAPMDVGAVKVSDKMGDKSKKGYGKGNMEKSSVDVAYPVDPLGKMIESGCTFSFGDYKCCIYE